VQDFDEALIVDLDLATTTTARAGHGHDAQRCKSTLAKELYKSSNAFKSDALLNFV
jgi:hypothetical protein